MNEGMRKKVVMFCPYIADSVSARVNQVLTSRWVGQGALVDEFEKSVETSLKIPHVVALNTSTSAIRLALTLCGVGPGDEVISTPMTCTQTNHPILEQFAKPVFTDIQYESGNMDPRDIEHRITSKTKAILCAHWGGQPADLDEIHSVARRYRLPVIEDASEALGAMYQGKPIGSISSFAAFSFQAVQIITTGEGGALAILNEEHKRLAKVLRFSGIDRERRTPNILGYFDFDITSVGYSYYMTNLAAAIGLENIKSLEFQLKHRRKIADQYRKSFLGIPGITLLDFKTDREPAYHFFTMHVQKREDFCRKMKSSGIEVSVVHDRNDIYSAFGDRRKDLKGLEKFHASYIGLPTHMHLSDEDVDHIIATVKSGW
ncbi:MAG: DegT/DnrJ/EryC1/StrS family aminotransferase [Candidatus Omnitrophica bacterium]|nr:DegT/DnrJ/EryC1/StrS family aminotransferase [Candidatus Omnitrophota bacterium]